LECGQIREKMRVFVCDEVKGRTRRSVARVDIWPLDISSINGSRPKDAWMAKRSNGGRQSEIEEKSREESGARGRRRRVDDLSKGDAGGLERVTNRPKEREASFLLPSLPRLASSVDLSWRLQLSIQLSLISLSHFGTKSLRSKPSSRWRASRTSSLLESGGDAPSYVVEGDW
jgi:hypothetical protein